MIAEWGTWSHAHKFDRAFTLNWAGHFPVAHAVAVASSFFLLFDPPNKLGPSTSDKKWGKVFKKVRWWYSDGNYRLGWIRSDFFPVSKNCPLLSKPFSYFCVGCLHDFVCRVCKAVSLRLQHDVLQARGWPSQSRRSFPGGVPYSGTKTQGFFAFDIGK